MNVNDASIMDAQHKLALITSTEALENAGIDFTTLSGSDTGVFAGTLDHTPQTIRSQFRRDSSR